MGAGRGGGVALARLGLRLHSGPADRARLRGAAVAGNAVAGGRGTRHPRWWATCRRAAASKLDRGLLCWRGRETLGDASSSLFFLLLFRHAVESLLHVFHLTAEVVDIVLARSRLLRWFLPVGRAAARRHERLEHREGLLEQFHVAANMFFERREGRAAQRISQLLAEFFLLARQRIDRLFEIFRHHHLHAVAIEANELPQERGR